MTYRCPGCAEIQRTAKDVPERQAGVRVVLVPASTEIPDDA